MAGKKPTVRELKLVNGIAAGKTKRQAGIEAGYTGQLSTVSVNVSKALKKDNVQEALQKAFIEHGIDIDSAVAPIGKALRHEDLEMQLKGSDRALKLMGVNQNNSEGTTNYNFINVANEQKDRYGI